MRTVQRRSNALEYLYPKGKPAEAPRDVVLRLPLRIGLAFTPSVPGDPSLLATQYQQAVLSRVGAAFAQNSSVRAVEMLPSQYLHSADGFGAIDRLAAAFNLDVVGLVSYEQFQFTDTDRLRSLAYWTVIGVHVVKGEKNQTSTLMDVVVYDIPSRTLLFRGAGQSVVQAHAAPVGLSAERRKQSEIGLKRATDDLVANLKTSFAEFSKQAANGTVRGPGTPAVRIARADGTPQGHGRSGAGAFGVVEVCAMGLFALACRLKTRRR
jgi:rhombotail lipoprotein